MLKTIVGLENKDEDIFQKMEHSDKGIENWEKKRYKN